MGYETGAFLLNILTASNDNPWGFWGWVCPLPNNALLVEVVPTVSTNGLLYPVNIPPNNGLLYYFFSSFFSSTFAGCFYWDKIGACGILNNEVDGFLSAYLTSYLTYGYLEGCYYFLAGCENNEGVDCCGCENKEPLFYVTDPNNPPVTGAYFLPSSGFWLNKDTGFFSSAGYLSNTPPKTGACSCLLVELKLANKFPPVDGCGWVLPNIGDDFLVYSSLFVTGSLLNKLPPVGLA